MAASKRPTREDVIEGTRLLRSVLDLVESGELDASGRAGAGIVRRIEGAIVGAAAAIGDYRLR